MTPKHAVPALILALLLNTQAGAQSDRSLQFLSKQCSEDAVRVHLDPGPFQDLVGPGFSLVLEDGKALVLILGQVCSEYWLDGEPRGPTQEIHVWVSVEGLDDVRDVVGAQVTRPTMTWFSVFDGNANRRARDARLASSSAQVPIESVMLDPPRASRGGRASIAGDLRYSWRVSSASMPPARLVGVNHDVYARNRHGNIVLNRIQALVNTFAAASPGTLEVTGSTDALPLIRAGSYPISVNTFFPVWVRGTLGDSPPR
jgi:hypothetical protein